MPLVTNATPEPIKLPQWDIFQLGMLQNPAYQRVSDRSANRLAVNRLETFFSQHADNWEVAAGLWYQMLAGCIVEVRPTETEVTGWNAIAEAANMPIVFNENGFLTAAAENDT